MIRMKSKIEKLYAIEELYAVDAPNSGTPVETTAIKPKVIGSGMTVAQLMKLGGWVSFNAIAPTAASDVPA